MNVAIRACQQESLRDHSHGSACCNCGAFLGGVLHMHINSAQDHEGIGFGGQVCSETCAGYFLEHVRATNDLCPGYGLQRKDQQ